MPLRVQDDLEGTPVHYGRIPLARIALLDCQRLWSRHERKFQTGQIKDVILGFLAVPRLRLV